MSLPKIYTQPIHLDSKQCELLNSDGTVVILSPDDILNLKLMRDNYREQLHGSRSRSHRGYELDFETLERILKQIQ